MDILNSLDGKHDRFPVKFCDSVNRCLERKLDNSIRDERSLKTDGKLRLGSPNVVHLV